MELICIKFVIVNDGQDMALEIWQLVQQFIFEVGEY